MNHFTIYRMQIHTHSQIQSVALNIKKGRLFEPPAKLFEPQENSFQFSAENKEIFNNSVCRRPDI